MAQQPPPKPPGHRRAPTVLPPARRTTIAPAAPVPPPGKRSSRAPKRASLPPREPSLAGASLVEITRALDAMPGRGKARMLRLVPVLAPLLAGNAGTRLVELVGAFAELGADDQELIAGLALRLRVR